MTIVRNIPELSAQLPITLHQYLEGSPLDSFLQLIQRLGLPAVVFGGGLRDLALSLRPRDVDIVVDADSLDPLFADLREFPHRQTRFGGFHFRIHGWRLDIWTLRETWAFKSGIVSPPSFSNLPKTTFLNVEAVAADLLPQEGGTRKLYANGFFEALASQVVETNLENNPFPDLCVVRALLTAVRLDFDIGPRLARYISEKGRNLKKDQIEQIQSKHYGEVKCDPTEMVSWIAYVHELLQGKASRIRLPSSKKETMALGGSWSP